MSANGGQGSGTMLGTGSYRSQSGSTAPPASEDPLVGRSLAGRYQIERKLGEGGMGAVYVGRHMTLDKHVAIKVLHPEYARKPDLVERFLQEAKAASKIRHENVIDITDFGITDDGMVFFSMEFLTGQDLHELVTRAKLEGRRVEWQRTAPIFLQICGAIEAAHTAGVIHRDLKPENIFLIDWLANPDFVKLLDFGIAKMTEVNEEGRKLTKTGMLFGTPEYMSPEQARGDVPDHRVDVYALGCILFQLVTGDVPFAGESFMAVLAQHLTAPPPIIGAEALAAVGAPAGLAAVIACALEKNREDRYESAAALADAVREVSGGELVSEAVVSSRTRSGWRGSAVVPVVAAETLDPVAAGAVRSRRRSLVMLALGLALVAIIGIAAVVVASSGDDATQADAETPAAPATPETEPDDGEASTAPDKTVTTPNEATTPSEPKEPKASELPAAGQLVGAEPVDKTDGKNAADTPDTRSPADKAEDKKPRGKKTDVKPVELPKDPKIKDPFASEAPPEPAATP